MDGDVGSVKVGGMQRVGCMDWREVKTKSRVAIDNNSWQMKQSILTT
jgi:hypothetical protein